MNTLVERMQSATVRFEKLIYFTGAEQDGEELLDLFQDHDGDVISWALGIKTDNILTDSYLTEGLEDAGYTGYFFANVHTPIRKYHEKGSKGFMFSWGTTTFTLLCAKSFEELVDLAINWAERKQKEMKDE